MRKKLQCTNPECESNNGDEVYFMVNMTVDEEGVAIGSSQEISGQYHECCHCGSPGEWKEFHTRNDTHKFFH